MALLDILLQAHECHQRAGSNLIAAYDPYDGIGIMDSYFSQASFFTEFERFGRHIEKLKRGGSKIDYVSIYSQIPHDSIFVMDFDRCRCDLRKAFGTQSLECRCLGGARGRVS